MTSCLSAVVSTCLLIEQFSDHDIEIFKQTLLQQLKIESECDLLRTFLVLKSPTLSVDTAKILYNAANKISTQSKYPAIKSKNSNNTLCIMPCNVLQYIATFLNKQETISFGYINRQLYIETQKKSFIIKQRAGSLNHYCPNEKYNASNIMDNYNCKLILNYTTMFKLCYCPKNIGFGYCFPSHLLFTQENNNLIFNNRRVVTIQENNRIYSQLLTNILCHKQKKCSFNYLFESLCYLKIGPNCCTVLPYIPLNILFEKCRKKNDHFNFQCLDLVLLRNVLNSKNLKSKDTGGALIEAAFDQFLKNWHNYFHCKTRHNSTVICNDDNRNNANGNTSNDSNDSNDNNDCNGNDRMNGNTCNTSTSSIDACLNTLRISGIVTTDVKSDCSFGNKMLATLVPYFKRIELTFNEPFAIDNDLILHIFHPNIEYLAFGKHITWRDIARKTIKTRKTRIKMNCPKLNTIEITANDNGHKTWCRINKIVLNPQTIKQIIISRISKMAQINRLFATGSIFANIYINAMNNNVSRLSRNGNNNGNEMTLYGGDVNDGVDSRDLDSIVIRLNKDYFRLVDFHPPTRNSARRVNFGLTSLIFRKLSEWRRCLIKHSCNKELNLILGEFGSKLKYVMIEWNFNETRDNIDRYLSSSKHENIQIDGYWSTHSQANDVICHKLDNFDTKCNTVEIETDLSDQSLIVIFYNVTEWLSALLQRHCNQKTIDSPVQLRPCLKLTIC